jgi:hypothetical protein
VEALSALASVATNALITSDPSKGESADWSDAWTDEDLEDLQRASMANFDARGEELNRESQGTDPVTL